MEIIVQKLENQFNIYFVETLSEYGCKKYKESWKSSASRTSFYENDVFPKVAAKMKLDNTNELFRIDYLLHERVNGVIIPVIAIESENTAKQTYEEMQKLISLSCPVKVLITCCEWSSNCTKNSKEIQNEMLEMWNKYLKAAKQLDALHGVYCFYVAEWGDDNNIRYFKYVSNDDKIDEVGEVFRICMEE